MSASVPGKCPVCGKAVRIGRRWGRIYSHQGDAPLGEVCRGTGMLMGEDEHVDFKLEPTDTEQSIDPIPPSGLHQSSTSVRALGGGLPTLGKRRH